MKQGVPLKNMGINYKVLPVFSDRSITASQVASLPEKGNKKKAAKKEGTIRVIFLDSVSQSSVADVIMTPIAAAQLVNGIKQSIEKLDTEIKDPKIASHTPVKTQTQQTYIG